MAAPLKADQRPLSPHLQVWRWHVTMATSIFHRASGVALYAGAIGLAVWLTALAGGPDWFALVNGWVMSPLGRVALYAMTAAIAYHFANGLRHLAWDSGAGLTPKTADATGWLVIFFALIAPLGVWALAGF